MTTINGLRSYRAGLGFGLIVASGVALAFALGWMAPAGRLASFLLMAGAVIVAVAILLGRIHLGLYLLVFLVPLEGVMRTGGVTLARVAGLVVFASWMLKHLSQKRSLRLLTRNAPAPLVSLVAIITVSILWAPDKPLASQGIITMIQLLGFFIVLVDTVRSWRQVRLVTILLLMGAAVGIVMALYQFYINATTIGFASPGVGLYRVGGGISGGVNKFATTTAATLPLAFYYIREKVSKTQSLLAIAYVIAAFVAVAASFSRQAYFVYILMFVLSMATSLPRISLPHRVVSVALFLVGVMIAWSILPTNAVIGRFQRSFEYSPETGWVTGRFYLWQAALQAFVDRPVLGVGFENAPYQIYARYRYMVPMGYEWLWAGPASVHSMYVKFLAELGIMGVLALIWVLWFLYHRVREARAALGLAKSQHPAHSWLLAAVRNSLLGYLLVGILATTEADKLLWLLIALIVVIHRLANEHHGSEIGEIETRSVRD